MFKIFLQHEDNSEEESNGESDEESENEINNGEIDEEFKNEVKLALGNAAAVEKVRDFFITFFALHDNIPFSFIILEKHLISTIF